MKATDLLKKQHDDVAALFKRIEKSKSVEEKGELFEQLASSLAAHDTIEREIFYPVCEEKMGLTDMLGEALVEHGVVEFSLFLANNALGENDFDYKMKVLQEIVEHHVEEEEEEFFPKVEKKLGDELLETLGARMSARFDEAKGSDFRVAVRANLVKVLHGEMKAGAPKARSAATQAVEQVTAR